MDNEVEWQITEVSRGASRMVKVHGLRRSRARLQSMLSPTLKDASREIDRAYEELESGWGVILTGFLPPAFTRTPGTGSFDIDMDKVDAIRKRISALKLWEKNCPKMLRNIVYTLNQTDHTATSYAKFTNTTTPEVTMWYREGLRIYAKLQGWE